MSQELEEIKSRLNIVDVISSYIKLEKAGVNYRARCPFHEEKSPSFFVSPSRQIWHCFGGCNEGGDIFKFVMKIEGIEFYDALKILADRAGVELKQNKEWKEAKTQRQILLDLNEKACLFFEYQLEKSKKGLEAKEYLFKRGLKEETIKNWRLGYAPDTWQGLTDFLISRGFKREDIIKTGLTIEKDKKSFDRFRSRIIFPITSFNSEVIGFTGRIFGKDDKSEAKYLNSPASILYDKSKALYGIDKAKIEIRKKDSCILVEGNVDCIMSHQAGIDNCIAVSGTALTNLHLGIIKRYSKNLVLAFDMDSAGNKATEKAIEMAGEFNVKVIPRIKDKDPADIILNEGEDFWKKIVQESQPVSEFFFNIALMNKNISLIEDKKKILKEFLPRVKNMESSVEQSYWIERLVNELKIKEEDIRTELKKIGLKKQELSKNQECLADKKTRRQMIEEKILALVLRQRSRIETIKDFSLFSSPIKEILEKVKEKQDIAFEELQEQFKDDNNFLNYIFLKSEVIEEVEEEELRTCILEIESLILKEKQIGLHLEIKNLEKKGDFNKVKELLEQFKTLIKYEEKNKKEESCIKEEDSQEKETSQEESSKEESLEKEKDPEEETSQEN